MPIYEYRCDNCGHELETMQKVSDPPLTTCPACEQDTLRKKISAAAFRLKGGGWYETDFKSDKKRNVAGEEKASDGGKADGAKAEKGADKAASDGAAATAKAESSSSKSGGDGKSSSDGKSGAREKSGSGKGGKSSD